MYVYILKSETFPNKFYVGLTESIEARLKKHNNGEVPYTAKYKPWKLINYIWFESKEKAVQFEQYLKSGSGRAFSKKHL